MFYAEYCKYGINVAYASFNGNAYMFYAFDTKTERDEFVENNEYIECNCVCRAISSKQMYYLAGRRFELKTSKAREFTFATPAILWMKTACMTIFFRLLHAMK